MKNTILVLGLSTKHQDKKIDIRFPNYVGIFKLLKLYVKIGIQSLLRNSAEISECFE